jgi:hypothetical protein
MSACRATIKRTSCGSEAANSANPDILLNIFVGYDIFKPKARTDSQTGGVWIFI